VEHELRPAFRLIPIAHLPWPHEPFRCVHAARFTELETQDREAGQTESRVTGQRFLSGLTQDDRQRCYFHQADWLAIATAAETIFGVTGERPDDDRVLTLVASCGLPRLEQVWLESLFSDAIVVSSTGWYINGQHRGCALRFSGARNALVSD
jgi:hypothetical protein